MPTTGICSVYGENKSLLVLSFQGPQGSNQYPRSFPVAIDEYMKVSQWSAMLSFANETAVGSHEASFSSFYVKNGHGRYGYLRSPVPKPVRDCCTTPKKQCRYLEFLDLEFATFADNEIPPIPVDLVDGADPHPYCRSLMDAVELRLQRPMREDDPNNRTVKHGLCTGRIITLQLADISLPPESIPGGLSRMEYTPVESYIFPVSSVIPIDVPNSQYLACAELLPGLVASYSTFLGDMGVEFSSFTLQSKAYAFNFHKGGLGTYYGCYAVPTNAGQLTLAEIDRRIGDYVSRKDAEFVATVTPLIERRTPASAQTTASELEAPVNDLRQGLSQELGIL